ncbi:hypothetical protein AJ85_03700 [Alkalihalobacillus alcalophilus ATCC 27647 = CGMCC 1.3604]|uniref:Uncharacterized protein n=1 Tax=Alkalihalobacillus alcalophilus ATCC 27647 = CGMCC 1.3604 TaxID=1218173 RepID=A0A094WFC0_ALKAL|nr:hypothetical protein [Alkalihalobacillus alcalophilus]YP_009276811.1 hypothetical protein BH791_gp05 [Bacillus phage BalMu-1]AJA42383.1 hypothetical protein BalMu1_B5 [Bacillus phage BalMu-1]AJA42439.1 hypothetical protein BalMu1_A5 [Bacillus phage BalMu-1]KGA95461.1 hypothetical protein BALCAV_0222580 [Alkalihalobacillus alcalophilus ATCC 27647 = CGMCC 1.3604]MED1563647.1 hypothetical protein [Alkalihalobacillus alcalophilus]THG88400.1 hypothetical protein AJ85_03700 [Alkalihalobacillus a
MTKNGIVNILNQVAELAENNSSIKEGSTKFSTDARQHIVEKQLESLDFQRQALYLRVKEMLSEAYSEIEAIERMERSVREAFEPVENEVALVREMKKAADANGSQEQNN